MNTPPTKDKTTEKMRKLVAKMKANGTYDKVTALPPQAQAYADGMMQSIKDSVTKFEASLNPKA